MNLHRLSGFPDEKIRITTNARIGFFCNSRCVRNRILTPIINLAIRQTIFILIVPLICLLFHSPASGQQTLKVGWNPNPENDIVGYRVLLGTSSGAYPVVTNVGNVTTHVFSGLTPDKTYYCAVQATNNGGLMSLPSAEISFVIPSSVTLFNEWAAAAGLSGAEAALGAMPFHDGVGNLLKFAFNMDAARADVRRVEPGTGIHGLPDIRLQTGGIQPLFRIEFLRRKGGVLGYVPKISTDMNVFEPMTGNTTITPVDASWERVVIEKPITPTITPKLFGVVEVVLP